MLRLHESEIADPLRRALDSVGVPGRLLHVRDYVWRGGELRFQVDQTTSGGRLRAYYELRAAWAAPVLERANWSALARPATATVDGRWVRGTAGYQLAVGIDMASPSAIYVRTDRLLSSVPFVNRPLGEVEQALAADLAAYVETFLSSCQPVPLVMAEAAERLHQLLG
jgi:hypothetical protein